MADEDIKMARKRK